MTNGIEKRNHKEMLLYFSENILKYDDERDFLLHWEREEVEYMIEKLKGK